jgi:pimeloyl-ACP methyl ester carboxylesterase
VPTPPPTGGRRPAPRSGAAVTRTVPLGDGRVATLDDVGDPGGVPVLYLHGTPDSRLARHPDDGWAADAGVRLLAVDRPGYGGSSPPATPWSPEWPDALAVDTARVLDALGVRQCAVLAWSGGALSGLALATSAATADRVGALGIVAGLVPREAYEADAGVRAAGIGRLGVLELADALGPGELGAEVAPMLAPYPCDTTLAAEHQAEHRTPADTAELAGVPGGAERMAAALAEAVRIGLDGAAADVEAQARPLAVDPATITCPVHLWYGTDDVVTPPAFGRWYEARVPRASLTVVEGAAHFLAFTWWDRMLTTLAAALPPNGG